MSQRVPASRRPAALPAVFAGALIALFGPAITAQAQVLNPPPPAYTPPTLTAAYACQGAPGDAYSIPVTITEVSAVDKSRGPSATGAHHVKVSPSLPAGAGTFDLIYPSGGALGSGSLDADGQPLSQRFADEDAAMNTKDPGLGVFDIPNTAGDVTLVHPNFRLVPFGGPSPYNAATEVELQGYNKIWRFTPAPGSPYCADLKSGHNGNGVHPGPLFLPAQRLLDDPRIVPGAPAVVPAATSARITVTPLQVAHEAAKVTEYVAIARPGDQTCTVAASATPLECTITGLSPETEYQFRVASKGGWLNPLPRGSVETPSFYGPIGTETTTPLDGVCGSADTTASATAPADDTLCTTGTASAVTGTGGAWGWSCQGSAHGKTAACSAPYASQSITLKASPASTTIGQQPANVSANSDSGRPAKLSTTTSTVCTVGTPTGAGSLVTAMVFGQTAGTCTVKASLAGTGDVGVFRYLAASDQTVDITVSKGVQKITTFSAGKTTLKVGEMTTLSAEGGASDNPVTFSSLSTETCFVSGSMVTALSAGTCTVAADQAGNDGYNDAAQATLDITVTKAAQLISGFTANPSSLKVGGMATLSASGGASGNPVTFSSKGSEVCSVSGSMVTALSAGTCTLIASQAGNADFEDAEVAALELTVGKAAQLISGFTANPTTIKVGQASQLSAFGGASGKPIVFAASTADTCSVSGSTVTALAVGNCTVTANQAGSTDFEAAEPAMLTIGIEAADVATGPVLKLDMNDLDFGTGYLLRFRDIGVETTSEAEVVTLSNTGTSPLAISSIVTTGDFRHTTTCGVSVAPGATCTISIRFSPKAVGTRTGETRIVSNAVSSPDLIRLSGTGKGLQPAIKTNVSSFDFGRVRVGATSLDRTLVITSSGSGPLEIRNIAVSGDYVGSHNCPRWLDAGKSCQVTGRFRPRATGVRAGTVSILSSVSNTPTQVSLSGTGF